MVIIIQCNFFFLFIGRKPTTWPTNNGLLMRKRNHAFLFLVIALAWKMADRFASRRYSLKNKLGDRMIKQLLKSIIAKYRDLSVSRKSIRLATRDKSRYFAQPRPIIDNYFPYFYSLRAISGGDWPSEWAGAKQEPKESLFAGYCFYHFTYFGKYPFAILNLTYCVSYNLYMLYRVNMPI